MTYALPGNEYTPSTKLNFIDCSPNHALRQQLKIMNARKRHINEPGIPAHPPRRT